MGDVDPYEIVADGSRTNEEGKIRESIMDSVHQSVENNYNAFPGFIQPAGGTKRERGNAS